MLILISTTVDWLVNNELLQMSDQNNNHRVFGYFFKVFMRVD